MIGLALIRFNRCFKRKKASNVVAIVFVAMSSMLLSIFCGADAALAADSRRDWVVEVFEKNRAAVVSIQGGKTDEFANVGSDAGKIFNGMGTGTIIDERGYIVTNYHVVEGIRKIQVITHDKSQFTATLVGRDTETDLAIIKINPRSPLQTITLGRSDDLISGERCMSIGNPFGYSYTVTDGRVSGLEREVKVNEKLVYNTAIQTSAPINPGNSGGPLINIEGEMIGLNAAVHQGAVCVAFAIPVDRVVRVASELIGEMVGRGNYHGIRVAHADEGSGRTIVFVDSVDRGSPAVLAGLQEGDIIEQVGKYPISNSLDFARAFIGVKANEDVAMTVVRDAESYEATITLANPRGRGTMVSYSPGHSQAAASPKVANKTGGQASNQKASLDDLVWERLGIQYEPMPSDEFRGKFASQLREYAKQKKEVPTGAVVITDVRPNSPFAEEGVMAGDVIIGIHGWAMTSQNDVRYVATVWSGLEASNNLVRVDVFRDGVPYFADVPLE